ncbi:PTS sugar transporter subunit IIB [Caloramator australicus]|uniref:PTS sugar transporter subunit IIB n=1 Tax=Caloramator australicus TaxID=515264 RepID=UPI00192B55C5
MKVKILVCCGNGLGSSFMLEMNVNKVLKELNLKAEVEHSDLASAKAIKADIYIATKDLANQMISLDGYVIILNSIINLNEIKEKLIDAFKKLDIDF